MKTIPTTWEVVIVLNSFKEWLEKCPKCLPEKKDRLEYWLWLDRHRNVMQRGEDFMAAHKNDGFPVTVYRIPRAVDYKKNMTIEQTLEDVKKEYQQLLADEYEETVHYAALHGWKSSRYEKGKELRERIAYLETQQKGNNPDEYTI